MIQVMDACGNLKALERSDMGIFNTVKRVDVDIRDSDRGPYVEDVRGVNDGVRQAMHNAVSSNLCYDEDGDMPAVHPDFRKAKPYEVPLERVVFHIFGRRK
jgi:hypothetical protein